MTRGARVLAFVSTVLAGVAVGALGAFFQALRSTISTPWGPVALPWGAILMIAGLLVVQRWCAVRLRSASAAWLVFAGWLAATALFALESPSGDLAISAGARQWGYLLAGVVLGAAAATFPVRRLARVEG